MARKKDIVGVLAGWFQSAPLASAETLLSVCKGIVEARVQSERPAPGARVAQARKAAKAIVTGAYVPPAE